ncbi:LytTR family transcriptional regulator DNA-binding domain-containing protein [Roseivirga sp.]|uniref:LytTR family transcriptional regulator DNA-binding domain-containing protein n=1 Tax=Roseivirga sp. TaxID=1964215 RepID=UPI003B529D8D
MCVSRITLILLLVCSSLLHAQRDFQDLKSDILQAETELKRLEGLITLGSVYNRTQVDSIYFYADSLANSDYQNPDLALAGKQFLEAIASYHQGDLNRAIGELEISRRAFQDLGFKSLQVRAMNFLGIAYTRTNELEQALDIQNEMIALCGDDPEYTSAKRSAYGNQANVYKRLGEFSRAIYSLEKTIELSEGDTIGPISMSYLSLGQMLTSLRLYERSLDAYRNIKVEYVPSESVAGAVYAGMGQVFMEMDNLDSSYYYFNKTYEVTSASGHWQQTLRPQLEMAKIAVLWEKPELAQKHIETGTSLLAQYRFPPPARIDLYLAKIQLKMLTGELEEARAFAVEFEEFINRNSIVHLSKNGFRIMSELYQQLDDTETALKYEKLYSDLEISPQRISENARIAEQRSQLALLEKDDIIEQESAQKAFYQGLTFQIVAVTVLLLGATIFLFRYYRKEKSENISKESQLTEIKSELDKLAKENNQDIEHITLKSKALIRLNDLNYISSDGPYLELHLISKEKPEVDRNTLKNIISELPSKRFIQVHRSHIVNIDYVKSVYSSKVVMQDGTELSVSRSFREKLDSILNNRA